MKDHPDYCICTKCQNKSPFKGQHYVLTKVGKEKKKKNENSN